MTGNPVSSETVSATSLSLRSFSLAPPPRQSRPIFSTSAGITCVRSALPHLSPSPIIVPCTCLTPSFTATIVLATAQPASLWVCTPSVTPDFSSSRTSLTIDSTSWGREPPLVSQRTTALAPPSSAALSTETA